MSDRPGPDDASKSPDGDDPPTPDEIAASERLRDALEDPSKNDPDADLARSLQAAFAPEPLAASELGELAAAALDASPEELRAAEALRDRLAGDELVTALHAAWSPASLSEAEHRAIVDAAVAKLPASAGVVSLAARRARLVRVSVSVVTGALALAASIFFVVRPPDDGRSELPLAKARSTQALFSEPFKAGDASARIDRIALARASDYRDNRFTRWGVK
jgi:hypothetical protein